jgi:hypothetical protein
MALAALASAAEAQTGDRVEVATLGTTTQVAVVSGGKRMIVDPSVGYQSTAQLLDLDGDGASDVVVQNIYLDGWGLDLWLRRGDRFVQALYVGVAPPQAFIDIEGDGKLEALLPKAEADAILFEVVGIHENDIRNPEGDLFRMFRHDQDKFVPAKIECAVSLRPSYIAAIDDLVAKLKQNETPRGSSLGIFSFDKRHLEAYRKELAAWRKRFEEGCLLS